MATSLPREQAGATDARPRPGQIGRGDRARQRVLAAALDQLADEGSAGFTMQSIARRAGASKATLYRHWPSASALLVDAMAEAFRPFPAPATGDLLTAPFFYRRLIAHRPIPPSMARAIVDQTLGLT